MGNQSSNSLQVTKPLEIEWQEVLLDRRQADTLNYVLLKNIETSQQAQEYLLNLPTDTLQQELGKYNLRCTQKLQLVAVKHVQVLEGGGVCSGVKNRLRVVTERITRSLANHPKLSYQQGFRVLLKSLIGFRAIYQFVGYIPIHSKLIFFNQYGDVKVWMNQDLPLNVPQRNSLPRPKENSQANMIQQIFATIEFHMINPSDFSMLSKKILSNKPLSFNKIINLLHLEQVGSRVRSVSPYSSLNGKSNQVQSMIKTMADEGFKVISLRQMKRYVEEPGQVIYRKIDSSIQRSSNNKSITRQISPRKIASQEELIGNYSSIHSRKNIQQRQRSPYKNIQPLLRNVISPTPSSKSPLRIIKSPQKSQILQYHNSILPACSINNKSIHNNSRQNVRQKSPYQDKKAVYFARNINSSPSSRNSILTTREKMVSASPYFQQKSVQPPSYVVNQPIIRIPSKEVQMSKVSRVSINSNKMNPPQNKIVEQKTVYAKIIPQSLLQQKQIQAVKPQYNNNFNNFSVNQYEGALIAESSIFPLRKQPSIDKNVQNTNQKIETKEDNKIQYIRVGNNNPFQCDDPQQNRPSKKNQNGKQVQWIKVSTKNKDQEMNKKQSSQSSKNSNHSKIATQVPNSPTGPQDIITSYEDNGGAFTNNRFSVQDLIQKEPANSYGLQVDLLPSLQTSNQNSYLNSSQQQLSQKKKMVIYTDLATIHCDDAIIEGNGSKYRISGDDQIRQDRSKGYLRD